jgi:hypothetical protein
MPTPLRDPKQDVIKSGALRLTWVSAAIAGVSAIVVAFNDATLKIFGEDLNDRTKAAVLVAIIVAWAAIAVADLFARAIAVAGTQPPAVVTAPGGIHVTRPPLAGDDETGWAVVAIEVDGSGSETARFLVSKAGHAPEWVQAKDLKGA